MSLYASKNQTFSQINITPLTDVMLVLLVIMILLAPLTSKTVLKVGIPQTGKAVSTKEKDDSIKISVSKNGSVTLDGKTMISNDCVTIQKQIEAAQKRLGTKDLLIKLVADPLSQQKHVVAVMDAAAGAGVSKLTFSPED